MIDFWWLPFLVGFAPTLSYILYDVYKLCWVNRHLGGGFEDPEYVKFYNRLTKVRWLVVVFLPIGAGIGTFAVWWSLALLMGVTP